MLTQNFQVGRPVGTGHSRPNDVIRLRRALNETGHGSSPPDPSGVYDPSLIRSIERFQSDYGLKQDGIVQPGGPTERMLDLALAAQRQGGDDGQAQLRDTVAAITAAGLKPEAAPPGDKRPIVFTDENGETATPDRLAAIFRQSLQQSPDGRNSATLLASTGAAAAPAAGSAAAGAISPEVAAMLADLGPIGLAVLGVGAVSYAADIWGKAHPEFLARKQSERDAVARSIAERATAQGARRAANGASDGKPPPPLPVPAQPFSTEMPHIPNRTEPQAAPPSLPDRTEFPSQAAKLPEDPGFPAEAPQLPQKVIFETLDDSEFWRQLSIVERPGSPETRMLNHLIGNRAVELGKSIGKRLKVLYGGYETPEKYRREGYLAPKGPLQVPGRPTLNASYPDIVVIDEDTNSVLYLNTTNNYANGELKPREARQAYKISINGITGSVFAPIPKPRDKNANMEEYSKQFDQLLLNAINKMKK